MKINSLKAKDYSIIIGKNSITSLASEVRNHCPKCKKIALIIDKKIPQKFLTKLRKKLKKYKLFVFFISSSEKIKSLDQTNLLLDKLLKLNFNRSDLIIALGGGIIGDMTGFVASIFKRGINFINLPSTLLSQVDSCIGGKTGVNSKYGKNLIGSFYNPKVVISDTELLKSLPKREIICGYAEILKHAIINDKTFFNFLKKNTKNIILLKNNILNKSILKSCKIKLNFTEKDFKEKNLRMKLNFGHTFAHALEIQNRYSNKLNHGEAVLIGMLIAIKISKFNNVCSTKTLDEVEKLYKKFSLIQNLSKYLKKNEILKSIKFMKNDKKKDDEKINLILLNNIGKTTAPGKFKYRISQVQNLVKKLF
tara:strand:+ start:334 stop:1428 length:1095 start_codon:yes stop_codon:yes gene_type:complete